MRRTLSFAECFSQSLVPGACSSHSVLLHDDIVTPIIEGLDESKLMVKWVVGAKAQVLVGVGLFPVYLNPHPCHPYMICECPEKGYYPLTLVYKLDASILVLLMVLRCSVSSSQLSLWTTLKESFMYHCQILGLMSRAHEAMSVASSSWFSLNISDTMTQMGLPIGIQCTC